VRGVSN